MRLSQKAARIIFVTTALVLLATSYLLFRQINALVHTQATLAQTNLVKLRLSETVSSLKDAETAQRGFLLTGDSLFLQPYYGAYERSKSLLKAVGAIRQHRQLQQEINALTTLIDVRFRTFDQVIAHYNHPQIGPDTRKQHLLRGEAGMDSIRRYVQKISEAEDALIAGMEGDKQRYNFLTPFYAVLLMVFAISILIISYIKITGQLRKTKRLLYRLRRLNSDLKASNHRLEVYNKELDSFNYIASHDLKEPVRKILTYTAMIEESVQRQLPDCDRVHFEKIKRSAQRMRNLLADLMHYTQVTGNDKLQEPTDLNAVMEEVKLQLEEEIRDSGATIRYAALPVVKAIPYQLRQLLHNLIANAIKFRRTDSPPVISLETSLLRKSEIAEPFLKTSQRYYHLLLRDNGVGFNPAYADKIFKLFYRVHAQESRPGTGIGLTICKKIIDNHKGFIKASSEVNRGTVVEIYLPA